MQKQTDHFMLYYKQKIFCSETIITNENSVSQKYKNIVLLKSVKAYTCIIDLEEKLINIFKQAKKNAQILNKHYDPITNLIK